MSFKLDTKKFKKIAYDKHFTTMQHEDGHTLKVAHAPLHPKMREQLAALPLTEAKPKKMADGGKVEPKKESDNDKIGKGLSQDPTTNPKAKAVMDLFKANGGEVGPTLGSMIGYPGSPTTAPKKMADGTPDEPVQPESQPMMTPMAAPAQAPVVVNVNSGPSGGSMGPTGGPGPQPSQGVNEQTGATAPTAPPQAVAPIPQPSPTPQMTPEAPPAPGANDPYGVNATSEAFGQGIAEKQAGILGESAAQSSEGMGQAAALQQQVAAQQQQVADYQSHYKDLEDERSHFMHDVENQHIDPKHYQSTMGVGNKIATAIGMILGGFGAAAGQENGGVAMFNKLIQQDIDAQKSNLGKSENLLNANMKQFGNLRDATDMTRVMKMDLISNQLKLEAAKAQSPMAKAKALQASGDLKMAASQQLGQLAMRKTLMTGVNGGQIPPEMLIRTGIIAPADHSNFVKELKDAKDANSLRDNTLSAFDQLVKINTIANRTKHPIDATSQVNTIKGLALDKLTKDVSGRVTPETVKLVGSAFDTAGKSTETAAKARNELHKLLSQGMHYPTLSAYQVDANSLGKTNALGAKRIQMGPPVQ